MQKFMTKEQLYEASNKVDKVSAPSISGKEYQNVLASSEDLMDRQRRSQEFCDYLCDKFKIPRAEVKVHNKPQPHTTDQEGRLRSKTLGTYRVGREVINMYNLTAKQQKVVAIKTFTGTLLHEFMHHYDIFYLGFPTSYHTKGFYMRLSDLEAKCKKAA